MSVFHNNALIGAGGGAAAAGAADSDRSLRFESGDSSSLTKTFSSAGNRKTWTWSAWVKRSEPGGYDFLFQAQTSGTRKAAISFWNSDIIKFKTDSSDGEHTLDTDAVFRDPSAWYHIVLRFDTTQSTAANRIRIYVNGVEQTYSTAQYPSQNSDHEISNSSQHFLGSQSGAPENGLDGYMTDVYFIDGVSLGPTSFGAYDSNGVWQKADYTGTFGTNGFHLLDFANESTIGHDSSGNENDFTANNLSATGTAAPAVTSNGNPTSSTDSPFSSGYSVDFDGDDSLTITGPGAIAGDFTVECFVKSSSYAGTQRIFSADQASQSGERLNLRCYNGATEFYVAPGVSASGTTFPTNQWNHIAITRSGSDVSYYLNGSRWATDTHSGAISVTTFVVAHGFASEYFTGKVSNARFVDGQALYTGASYTQPTATLTTTSQGATAANVRLICCHQSSVTAAEGSVADPPSADILFDVPTNGTQSDTGAGAEVNGNYCCWNALNKGNDITLSNGNLDASSGSGLDSVAGTIGMSSGKWYWEHTVKTFANMTVGIASSGFNPETWTGADANTWSMHSNGKKYHNGSNSAYGSTYGLGDVIGVAFDADGGNLYFYINGTVQNSGTAAYTGLTSGPYFPAFSSTDATAKVASNWGQRSFAHSAPSGYKALCTTNLPTPTIADGSDYFDSKLFSGNGSSQTISGLEFSPDLVWIKSRSNAFNHRLVDQVQGNTSTLASNLTTQAVNCSSDFTGFTSDGFSLTQTASFELNNSSATYVAWAWDAGSSTASNTDGTLTASVRANATAGFSIATYTVSTAYQTAGHGLGVAPAMSIAKRRDSTSDWYARFKGGSFDGYLLLNSTAAGTSAANSFTSTTVPCAHLGNSNEEWVLYNFAPVAGYSAFGSYIGSGDTNGPFVYTGFKPAFILLKTSTRTGDQWVIHDTSRDTYNPADAYLLPNTSGAEGTISGGIDILSNGFKVRNGTGSYGGSGDTYIWYAVAENPFQANGGLAF